MKRCPVCNRESEDAAAFCNYDGHAFEDAVSEPDAAPLSDLISSEAPFEIARAAQQVPTDLGVSSRTGVVVSSSDIASDIGAAILA